MNQLENVVLAMDIVAFDASTENRFVTLTPAPNWFERIYRVCCQNNSVAYQTDVFDLAAAFPFVEHFLFDANVVWSDSNDGSVKSGIWTEDGEHSEQMMEAMAVKKGDHCFLVITNLTDTFSQRQQVYQKAREIALSNEKLVVELNHRQRSLQTQIESHLKHEASLAAISESVDSTSSAVMICQPDGSIEVFNKALVDIYQLDDDRNFSRQSLLEYWLKEAEHTYPEIKRVVSSGMHWEGEFETTDMAGHRKWIRLAIGPVRNEQKEIIHYVCVANDLSEYLNVNISDSGNVNEYDFTTHLPNRRYFWRKISATIKAGENCTLMYIDIDYFKTVNERIGHEAGDQLLGAMASRISRSVKRTDFVAHLGGDEFVVILCGDNVNNNVSAICDRVLGNIREPIILLGNTLSVSASIGYAECEQGQTASDLLKHADTAMYAAKELGRNHARAYSRDLDKRLDAFHHREYEIRAAIQKQEFVLYYQPQVSINEEQSFRLEALVRWQHPERGLVAPIDFIPVAESSGLIVPLGEWILTTACNRGNELLNSGVPVTIAVNISAKQLKHPGFFELLTQVMSQTDFPASRLELEITESCFLDDMERVIGLLEKIQALGISLSLDDFGSGFSSLNYLRRLPVDFLKIDRSFIQELPSDRESQIITSSVISLAHTLEKLVIAEGVETQEQFAFLKAQQCDYIQGFYFCKPVPFDQLTEIYHSLKGR